MNTHEIKLTVKRYTLDELSEADRQLVQAAVDAAQKTYSPYSNFPVGAAALLDNGKTVSGSNQENASFPVGLCAERVALSAKNALYPGTKITAMAIFKTELP